MTINQCRPRAYRLSTQRIVMFLNIRRSLAALLSLTLLGAPLSEAVALENEPKVLTAAISQANLPQSLNALPERAKVRIDAVELDAQGGKSVALSLEKFSVFAPDAVVVIDSGSKNERRVAPPTTAHFRGEVEGYPGSTAFWRVDESGHMKGILHFADGQIVVTEQTPANNTKSARSQARSVEKASDFAARDFQCGVDRQHTRDVIQRLRSGQQSTLPPVTEQHVKATSTVYTARIAIETDYEFFQRLGSEAAVTQYIADLFGYVSTVYADEIKTNLQVGNVYVYTNSSDPWSAESTRAALDEVGNYWQANRSAVTRTLTHFMSGKNVNGGIAWVGTLCNSNRGYGVSMGLDGNFSAANPQIIWDSVAIAHEIGHNFGSWHTHEWDTDNGGSPIDCCYRNSSGNGTCSSAYGTLPGVGSLTGGTSGTGAGTIMSYCHMLTPGMSNLSFTFGLNHTMGLSPARVPNLMRASVEAAALAPSCLVAGSTPSTYTLTVNSSGATGVAIGAVPTTYAGTSNYSKTGITAGTSLTLSAPSTAGSATFSNWTGCDSVSGVNCSLTMSAAKTVTASYSSALATQTITFGAAPSLSVGGTGNLTATASSGLPVTFSSKTSPLCTVSGSTVRGIAAGTCTVAANQAGNASTRPAPEVTQNISIASSVTTYTLTVNSSGATSVAIGAAPTTYAGTSNYSKSGITAGTSLTLSAPSTAGSATFSHWTGCDSVSGVNCSLTMNAAKSVTASYNSASTGSNLLQNPGFESGATAWTQASSGGYSLIVNDADNLPHAGSYYAWLGRYSSGTDRIEQSVTLPMNVSTATVDFWYEIWTAETSSSMANDTLKVELYNASGVKLSTLTTLSNLSASTGWVKSALFDISAYKGQSLTLRFTSTTDSSRPTSFLVDDVSLNLSLTSTPPPSGKGNKLGPMLMLLLN
jgi:hypothetical protein